MHLRKRHIQRLLSKRLRIFPVLGLVGPRQVGKTTFLMQEWKTKIGAHYVTLDRFEAVKRAKREPENFLLSESLDLKRKLIIDEAQKVPALFDSMKSLIDERRRVGIFTVSGSVEFSDRSGIRESLAGRMATCRLYPLTLAELAGDPIQVPWLNGLSGAVLLRKPDHVEKWLRRGGMPIFCALHDDAEIRAAIEGWLEAICYRDMQHLKGRRLIGDIALSILSHIARDPRVNLSRISIETGVSRSSVADHLSALEALFLIYKLPSLENRQAAPEYALFDCAVLRYLLGGGDETLVRLQSLRTLVINEIHAQYEYAGEARPGLFSYHTRGGADVDLVLQSGKRLWGIELSITSDIKPYALRGLKSFLARHKRAEGILLAPVMQGFSIDGIRVLPWTLIG